MSERIRYMGSKENGAGLIDSIWKFFASIQLSVVILLSLAGASIIGTLVPQNKSPDEYIREYGMFIYNLFHALNLFDMYHSGWFRFLLILLTMNILICSIDRLEKTWKIIFNKHPKLKESRFRNAHGRADIGLSDSPDRVRARFESYVSKKYGYRIVETIEGGFRIFAEKGRLTRLGVYIVHISVIFLLLGGLIGSIFGFNGFVLIPEGESVDHIRLSKTNELKRLDFTIRCDDFDVQFYETGAPKEFRSDLTVLEDGKEVLKKRIIVNDPLRYRGVSLYQSSYGTLPPSSAGIQVTSRDSGMVYDYDVDFGKTIDLPEAMGRLTVKEYRANVDFMGRDLGDAYLCVLEKDGKKDEIVVPIRFPNFDKMRKGEFSISAAEGKKRYYTGLQVSGDPGVLVVYAGFLLMIGGFFVTFFMVHETIMIDVVSDGKGARVKISGIVNKNRASMNLRLMKLVKNLEQISQKEE